MKTTLLLSLVVAMMAPSFSFAKVEDFNAMITENAQAQTQLRNELKEHMAGARQAQMKAPKQIIEIASEYGNSHNSPTKKAMTTYEKEAGYYRASRAKQMHRLANEMKAAGETF